MMTSPLTSFFVLIVLSLAQNDAPAPGSDYSGQYIDPVSVQCSQCRSEGTSTAPDVSSAPTSGSVNSVLNITILNSNPNSTFTAGEGVILDWTAPPSQPVEIQLIPVVPSGNTPTFNPLKIENVTEGPHCAYCTLPSSLEPDSKLYFQIRQEGNCNTTNDFAINSGVGNATSASSSSASSTSASGPSQTQGAAATFPHSASPTDSSSKSNTTPTSSSKSESTRTGTIVGIVMGCLAALAAVIFLSICWRRRQKNRREWPTVSDGESHVPLPQYMQAVATKAPVREHIYHTTNAPYQVSPLNSQEDLPSAVSGGPHSPLQSSPRVSNELEDRHHTTDAE